MQRFMIRLGVLMQAIGRTVYCWIFLIMSLSFIHAVYINILRIARTHIVDRGDIVSNMTLFVYSVVLCIAWWMILTDEPALKKFAIAANMIFIFTYIPALLVSWKWQVVMKEELGWWPVVIFGIFGIIIFSIPYHGWRHKTRRVAQVPGSEIFH